MTVRFSTLDRPKLYVLEPAERGGFHVTEYDDLDAVAADYTETVHGLPTPRPEIGDSSDWAPNECVILKAVIIQPKPKKIVTTFEEDA